MSYYPSPVQGSAPSAPPGGAAAFYGAYGGGTPPAPAAAPPQQGGQQQYQQQGQQHATLQAPLPLSAYYPQQPAQQPPQQRQQQAPVPYRPDMFSSLGGAGNFAPAPGAASPPGGAAGGVTQSFGVNLLSEEGFAPQRCVCEVSLEGLVLKQDGRVVKSYELEAIIRWSLYPKDDVFCFWVKSEADPSQQRAVRLSSDSRTTQGLLDALTSACLQLCELLGKGPHDGGGGAAPNTDNDEALARALALEDAKEALQEQRREAEASSSSSSAGAKGGAASPAPAKPVARSGLGLATLLKGKSKAGLGMNEEGDHIEYWKEPELSGWLSSQGEQIKTWRRRWFVFKSLQMFRFLDADVTPRSVPRGVIRMSDCDSVSQTDALGARKHALKIIGTDGEITYLIAENAVEMTMWLTKIEEGIDNAKGLRRAKASREKAAASEKAKEAVGSEKAKKAPAPLSEEEQLAMAIAASQETAVAEERARAPPPPPAAQRAGGDGRSLVDRLSASFEQQAAVGAARGGGGGGGGAGGLFPAYGSVQVVHDQQGSAYGGAVGERVYEGSHRNYGGVGSGQGMVQVAGYESSGGGHGYEQQQGQQQQYDAHAAQQRYAGGAQEAWGAEGARPHAGLPEGWQQLTSNEGRAYFFNSATGQTQWEAPQ